MIRTVISTDTWDVEADTGVIEITIEADANDVAELQTAIELAITTYCEDQGYTLP